MGMTINLLADLIGLGWKPKLNADTGGVFEMAENAKAIAGLPSTNWADLNDMLTEVHDWQKFRQAQVKLIMKRHDFINRDDPKGMIGIYIIHDDPVHEVMEGTFDLIKVLIGIEYNAREAYTAKASLEQRGFVSETKALTNYEFQWLKEMQKKI